MIHTHTMSHIKTVQEALKLVGPGTGSTFNIDCVTTYAVNIPIVVGTDPVTTGSAVVFPNTSLSYLKIIPVYKSTVSSPKFKVTGYSRCKDNTNTQTYWVPMCLFEGSVTLDTNAITIDGDTGFRAATTISKNMGDGKVYNATSVNDTAFVLIDTLGCELIKIEFAASSALTDVANAFVGGV